jgi:hypothetical protein
MQQLTPTEELFFRAWNLQNPSDRLTPHYFIPEAAYRVNFAHLPSRTGVIIDSPFTDGRDPAQIAEEQEKQTRLENIGWQFTRLSTEQLFEDTNRCVAEVRQFANRRNSPPPMYGMPPSPGVGTSTWNFGSFSAGTPSPNPGGSYPPVPGGMYPPPPSPGGFPGMMPPMNLGGPPMPTPNGGWQSPGMGTGAYNVPPPPGLPPASYGSGMQYGNPQQYGAPGYGSGLQYGGGMQQQYGAGQQYGNLPQPYAGGQQQYGSYGQQQQFQSPYNYPAVPPQTDPNAPTYRYEYDPALGRVVAKRPFSAWWYLVLPLFSVPGIAIAMYLACFREPNPTGRSAARVISALLIFLFVLAIIV